MAPDTTSTVEIESDTIYFTSNSAYSITPVVSTVTPSKPTEKPTSREGGTEPQGRSLSERLDVPASVLLSSQKSGLESEYAIDEAAAKSKMVNTVMAELLSDESISSKNPSQAAEKVIPDVRTSKSPAVKEARESSPNQNPEKTSSRTPQTATRSKSMKSAATRKAEPDNSPAAPAKDPAKKSSVGQGAKKASRQSSKLNEKPDSLPSRAASEQTRTTTSFSADAARRASFAKTPIVFDPSQQIFGVADPTMIATDDDGNVQGPSMMREESTNTRTNRRFIRVRYDEGRSGDQSAYDREDEGGLDERLRRVTLDSDEPDKSAAESIGDDDDDEDDSTSTPKPKVYRRSSGD
ncbi:uncharacterized protein LOC124646093 [Helicoverpa zea]|uniref:uncharacterized protein LOC124646093 n=1 Tax=Helicoverpa zea TaxID=7113 RepID=UPI001F592808|nr:uncharacterized protein LOC124646093 [Helicoverpa zea]